MKRKPHPADAADRDLVAAAVEFTAFLRLGPRKKLVERAATLGEAAALAAKIEAAYPGRRAIIYAVTAAGQSIPVPEDMLPAGKAAPAPKAKPAKAAAVGKPAGKRAAALAAAEAGTLPDAPDFTANTHKPHRKKLAEVVALVEAGDIAGLKAFHINPVSSSPKAIDRYRNLAVIALEARGV